MEALLKKLNFKGQPSVVLANLPVELAGLQVHWSEHTAIIFNPDEVESIEFALFFVTKLSEIEEITQFLATKWAGDAIVWLAYPKGSSKQYRCEFNRDTGWNALAAIDVEPVKQIAIDEDWSALRFRKVAYIKKMTRSFAMTASGKAKAGK